MGLDLSKETKSNVSLSLENKDDDITWDEANWTWDEATGQWDAPGLVLTKESKTNISLNLENK